MARPKKAPAAAETKDFTFENEYKAILRFNREAVLTIIVDVAAGTIAATLENEIDGTSKSGEITLE